MRALAAALAVTLGLSTLPMPEPAQAQTGARPAASARAQPVPPVRAPVPPRRPNLFGTLPGLSAGPSGLVRSPLPPARPGPAQVPASMVPVGIAGQAPAPARSPAPVIPDIDLAAVLAMPPAAAEPEATGLRVGGEGAVSRTTGVRPAPRGVPVAARAGRDLPAPVPRPSRLSGAVPGAVPAPAPSAGGTPFGLARPPAVAPQPRPARLTPPGAIAAAAVDPRAVARSPAPPRRTAAALRRFDAAALALSRQRARPAVVQPIPAALPPRTVAPSAEASGPGLCGMAGLQGRRLPRVVSQTAGCGIAEPVSLTHVHGIRLSQPAVLHCDAARATGRWVRDVAIPAMGRQGGGIAEIRIGAHYACRPRNHQRGARISEHGRGRAIDISGFRLVDGTQVTILRDYPRGPFSAALRRMRAGACGIYSTTLGPGSDRFHADHFHFDVAQHRGGGTFCR